MSSGGVNSSKYVRRSEFMGSEFMASGFIEGNSSSRHVSSMYYGEKVHGEQVHWVGFQKSATWRVQACLRPLCVPSGRRPAMKIGACRSLQRVCAAAQQICSSVTTTAVFQTSSAVVGTVCSMLQLARACLRGCQLGGCCQQVEVFSLEPGRCLVG